MKPDRKTARLGAPGRLYRRTRLSAAFARTYAQVISARRSRPRGAVAELRNSEVCALKAMRVLLIEDEPTTAKSIELMLGAHGFNLYTTHLGEEGLDLGKLYDYDIILLDLNLPDMHGYDVLKKLRTAKVGTPVLILSGIGEMDSKVRALGFGADDYVTKPFQEDELVARIHAIVRRSKGHSQSVIRTGKLTVTLDDRTVEVDLVRVHLTDKEYTLLEILALRKGSVVTREALLNQLYGGMDEPEANIIDVFLSRLRKKLRLAGRSNEVLIETHRGRGYVLKDSPPSD